MDAAGEGTLLAGGYRNEVRRRRIGRDWVIEKRYAEPAGPANPMYPNLPDSEARALALLGPLGLAPDLVAEAPGVLTYRYVPGTMLRPGRRTAAAAVARLLHAVHTVAVTAEFRELPASAAEARAHGDSMLADVGTNAAADRARSLRPAEVAADAPTRRALVHTDCGPGNIVRSHDRLVLIDWQCPGLGDPVEDITCFLSPAMMHLYGCRPHTPSGVAAFLAAYPDPPAVERYRRDAAAWHYRIAAYCAWRSALLTDVDPIVAERYQRAIDAEIELALRGPR